MSPGSVSAQAAQFWELLQRAQQLALSAQSTAFAKAAGQEFSIVDANSAGAAAVKAFAEFAQHPMELAAFHQTVWLDATKAWVEAWTGEVAAGDRSQVTTEGTKGQAARPSWLPNSGREHHARYQRAPASGSTRPTRYERWYRHRTFSAAGPERGRHQ